MATRMREADAQTPYAVIQYPALARELFGDSQRLVPFLGAGASISETIRPELPKLTGPEQDLIDKVCNQLPLEGAARDFLEASVHIAWQMQLHEKQSGEQENPFEAVQRSEWPPSAGELAAALAHMAKYDHFQRPAQFLGQRLPSGNPATLAQVFRWAAIVTGLASSPPLLSVASFCSYTQGPESVWLQLRDLFQNKVKPTTIHRMVACIARNHLFRPGQRRHYLIVTTNYDHLVEEALKLAAVPYCVLAVDKSDNKVDATPSEDLQAHLEMNKEDFTEFLETIERSPENCHIQDYRPVIVVYKIHGDLYPPRKDRDSVILTDEDYVDYMRKSGPKNDRIPADVKNLMGGKGFLFLGYSFSDWNVRSWYKSLAEDPNLRKNHPKDYAVMLDLDPYEGGFFENRTTINILLTKLNRFATSVMAEAPQDAKKCGDWQ